MNQIYIYIYMQFCQNNMKGRNNESFQKMSQILLWAP